MSPKRGPRTARDTAWLKKVPRAMAEGLTGGRSVNELVSKGIGPARASGGVQLTVKGCHCDGESGVLMDWRWLSGFGDGRKRLEDECKLQDNEEAVGTGPL